VIEKRRCIAAAHNDFPHVGDIKKAGRFPHRKMLGHDAFVLDGHFPSAKVYTAGT
jgi:hypothetical protein